MTTLLVDEKQLGDSLKSSILLDNLFEVKKLIMIYKVNINQSYDDLGNTPLHDAVEFGETDILLFLLAQNADLSLCNKNQYTPLVLAAMRKQYNALVILLNHGATFNKAPDSVDSAVLKYLAEEDNEFFKKVQKKLQQLENCKPTEKHTLGTGFVDILHQYNHQLKNGFFEKNSSEYSKDETPSSPSKTLKNNS